MADDENANKDRKIGKAFNKDSEADVEKLLLKEREKYQANKADFKRAQERVKQENDLRREERINREIRNLLNKPQPTLRPDAARIPIADEELSSEKFKELRERAEKIVRERERNELKERERLFELSQDRFLDNYLGRNRYPSRGRS